jgi:hypothetical protein
MHKERNVAESMISMCFDVTGFSKDNMNIRKDLAALYNRHDGGQKKYKGKYDYSMGSILFEASEKKRDTYVT